MLRTKVAATTKTLHPTPTRLVSPRHDQAPPSSLHHPCPAPAPQQQRPLSTSKEPPRKPNPDAKSSPSESDPETPSFSFKDLGATKTTRVVVYGALMVVGTAETVTWGTWAWRKFGPKNEDGKDEEGEGGDERPAQEK
ncbi:hypothetical protein BDY21DRAFT_342118 [Lineolata rhizophorae]|uniref:Uncharacterized protein n=1 Tax=Lineolata rhizophorae TaxID=578093 RepID=A0A6A6P3H0_9PEZI|nr:hypothetical protein BDY21DRAFT_342118 [Lineolata rhizophorae]